MQSLKTKLKHMHQEIPTIFLYLQNTINSVYNEVHVKYIMYTHDMHMQVYAH
jgi:hypothetical protein